MFIDSHRDFRLSCYDFRSRDNWILPYSAEVPGRAAVLQEHVPLQFMSLNGDGTVPISV